MKKDFGFTLAEVLIVIGVIGVVAVMTIPMLINKTGAKSRQTKINNIQAKLRQGTDLMKVQGQINGFNDTKEFVIELSKYMKMQQICDSSDLSKCWPGINVTGVTVNGRSQKVTVGSATDAGWFLLNTSDYTAPAGFITADGTPMIISYNANCEVDPNDTGTDGTACISGIFDINGAGTPNRYGDSENTKEKSDIIPINTIGGIGGVGACNTLIKGSCFISAPFKANDSTRGGCEALEAEGVDTKGCNDDPDYWANAYIKCKNAGGSLPNKEDLSHLATYLYDNGNLNYDRVVEMGFTANSDGNFWVWAVQPYSSKTSYIQGFGPSSTGCYYGNGYRSYSVYWGVCVEE